VLPPWEGYAPLEKAWRCIFPFSEECKGNIQREVLVARGIPWAPPVTVDPPDHRLVESSTAPQTVLQILGEAAMVDWCTVYLSMSRLASWFASGVGGLRVC
jgi:hypothetical protein